MHISEANRFDNLGLLRKSNIGISFEFSFEMFTKATNYNREKKSEREREREREREGGKVRGLHLT